MMYYDAVGFDPSDFDNIITSGDISHNLLRSSSDSDWMMCGENGNDGQNQNNNNMIVAKQTQNGEGKQRELPRRKNVFVFGSGDDDEEYCTSAGWSLSSIDDADLILARGTFTINSNNNGGGGGSSSSSIVVSKTQDEAEYWRVMEESMTKAARRKLPMLVSNPDKVRPGSSPPPPMPGAIGDTYERFVWTTHCRPVGDMTEESARGYVKRIGKPFREVYDMALDGVDRSRAIMVGDALETDCVGGNFAGIDMLWVTQDGIHGKEVEDRGAAAVLDDFNNRSELTYAYGKEARPRFLADHFKW